MTYEQKSAIVISQLRADRDRLLDAFDKIRDEIDQNQYDFMSDGDYNEGIRFGLMLAYQIIDKYKAESEESCDTCKHDTESWDSDACDGCCKANNNFESEQDVELTEEEVEA